jgi:hypothetical protein
LPGLPGGNANSGGGSGKLTISVIDGKEFEVHTSKEIGLAGMPGKGGPGQFGGPGGVVTKHECSGKAGANGANGKTGNDGLTALDGSEDPICIYIASEEKNDCL